MSNAALYIVAAPTIKEFLLHRLRGLQFLSVDLVWLLVCCIVHMLTHGLHAAALFRRCS